MFVQMVPEAPTCFVGAAFGPGQVTDPSAATSAAGKSQSGRSRASAASAGTCAYGETPASCTIPSQPYRAESVLIVGGPLAPQTPSSTVPSSTIAGAARRGVRSSSRIAATSRIQQAPSIAK